MSLLLPVRIALFYFMLAFTAFAWCLVSLVFAPFMAFRARYRFVVQNWCRCAVWLGKTLVGLRYEVHGAENVPARPCVILAKHQSTWETFFLSAYFEPLTQVLKRELLRVPFFGWAIILLKPIAIDRDNPKAALRQVAKQGHERLEQGAWVLIFPEGTRVPVGEQGKFSRSGAALAVNAGLPVLPIAHNAGMFWPKAGWGKRPGTIQVVIGQPMFADSESPRAIAELNQRAEDWINAQVSELEAQGRSTL
ncbi:MAG: 1-acyl-sn-glycerol-3-phosphate acyltransferase [Gammaproteobacteria bacterium HGW-Gammaproteobacteria-5]|uniref:lysophospholipid acyltransferase family protein n=1 Tax=Pseudomonas songnenensis TaxID=1176259 RepID=UPI000CC22DF0|nr:lysophospholipid acyltransferase family protein [Pseudomonas songnenensis]PKM09771.1 MAG: 1-acyl-sn-glycerol-3-phosphate acyltransferase [Gammaproteobacteria bacterium HGW-Gammaproteobacteria-5]